MKKILMLCLAALMLIVYLGCDVTNAQSKGPLPKVVMVTPKSMHGNESDNQLAYEGALKAANDYEIEMVLKETDTYGEYIGAISDAATEGADLVIAAGDVQLSVINGIAENSPDTLFAVIDSKEGTVADNVMCISFKDEEGAFLAGVIAALITETQVVGFVGGEKDKDVEVFEFGFRAGVKAANTEAIVLIEYIGNFNDIEEGAESAHSLVNQGADVIFHAAGNSGAGIVEVAEQSGIWVINADDNLSQDSKAVLCSTFKRVDNGVYLSIQSFMEGKFHSGAYEFGLDFEAVGYTDNSGSLTKETRKLVNKFVSEVLLGNILVPKNKTEFSNFQVPDLDIMIMS